MTDTPDDRPECIPAPQALLDFAAHTRPDIDRRDLEGALIALHQHGWTWPRILLATTKTLTAGETPKDLRAAIHDPLKLRGRHTR